MGFSGSNLYGLLGLVVAGVLLRTIILRSTNPLNKIPGPWHSKYTNLRLKLAVITGRRVHYIHSLHAHYGPFVRIAPNEVAINDPTAHSQIHSVGGGGTFQKSSWYHEVTLKPRPTLFVMSSNKAHAARRKLFARGFSKSNIKTNWEGVVKEKIELCVGRILEEVRREGKVDLLKWWILMASDVSSHLMFGESFHVLEAGEKNEFIRTLTKALKGRGICVELPLVGMIGRLLPFQTTKEFFQTQAILDEYAQAAVRNSKASGGGKNIFANILAEAEKAEGVLDDEDVKEEASGLFVAGTDTTAISITYLIWAVLERPELRRRVEEEVAMLPEGYEDADVERLPLLGAVIEETLRLYGAAPGALPRVVPSGGRDMGGYYFPQDTVVTTHAYSMHRQADLFPDPLEFKPERFLEEGGLGTAAKAMFTPFGAGARGCLGVHIAYAELRIAAAEFFRRCKGAKVLEGMDMEIENFFVIQPRGHKCEVTIG